MPSIWKMLQNGWIPLWLDLPFTYRKIIKAQITRAWGLNCDIQRAGGSIAMNNLSGSSPGGRVGPVRGVGERERGAGSGLYGSRRRGCAWDEGRKESATCDRVLSAWDRPSCRTSDTFCYSTWRSTMAHRFVRSTIGVPGTHSLTLWGPAGLRESLKW